MIRQYLSDNRRAVRLRIVAFSAAFYSLLGFSVDVGFPGLQQAAGATYYVDNGITDSNTASATPDCTNYDPTNFVCSGGGASAYATVADINAGSFQAGDSILFKRGGTWRESLVIPSSGSEGNPVTFGAFGSGNKPVITSTQIISGTQTIYDAYNDKNGGFEAWSGSPSLPTGWSQSVWGSSTASQESSTIHGGSYSAKLYKDSAGNPMVLYFQMFYSNSMRYSVKFWAKGASGNEQIGVRARHYSGGTYDCQTTTDSYGFHDTWSTSTVQAQTYTLTNSWQEYEFKFQNKLTSAAYIYMRFELNTSNSTVYLDDVRAYPQWTPHPTISNVYGINLQAVEHPGQVEIFKDSDTRIDYIDDSELSSLTELEDHEFAYSDANGSWLTWYRDDNKNPLSSEGILLEYTMSNSTIHTNGKSHLVIQNLEAYGSKEDWTTPVFPSKSAVVLVKNSTDVTVENLEIYLSRHSGLSAQASTDVTFDGNDVSLCGAWGIDAYGTTDTDPDGGYTYDTSYVTIKNNTAHNCGGNKQDNMDGHGLGANTAEYITIEHNEIYGNGLGGDGNGDMRPAIGIWGTSNSVIRYNDIHDNYRGGIQIAAGPDPCNPGDTCVARYNSNGNSVYYNLFYNNGLGEGTGNIVHSGIDIVANRQSGTSGSAANAENNYIYNNVIYNNDYSSVNNVVYGNSITLKAYYNSSVTVYVKNNLIYNNIGNYDLYKTEWQGGTVTATLDYNDYYRSGGGNLFYWGEGCYGCSWNQYHTVLGLEAHSINSDPLFTNAASGNFTLQSGSPAINAGIDVSLDYDYANNSVSDPPEMGAYEY